MVFLLVSSCKKFLYLKEYFKGFVSNKYGYLQSPGMSL